MPRWLRVALFVLLTVSGAVAGALVFGRTDARIGPVETTVSLRPSLTGGTVVALPPLGTLALETHRGPFGLLIRADEVDVDAARALADDPTALEGLEDDALDDTRAAVRSVLVRDALGAVLGAVAVALLRAPARRPAAAAALVAGVFVATSAASARLTWNEDAVAEPRYTGLLTAAPQAIGSVEDVRERFDAYRSQVSAMVGNVARLYNAASTLQSYEPTTDAIRVLHVSDIHLNPQAFDVVAQLVRQFKIDVVVDTGDINDWGTEAEGQIIQRIGSLPVPYVYVRGNHDSDATQAAVAAQPNAVVLDGDAREVAGLRFWGIGDPRFTPDKTEVIDTDEQREIAEDFAPDVGRQVRRARPVDIAVVHDPRFASRLGGVVDLVLAGHTHKPSTRHLGDDKDTLLLTEGSTGGAGLRTLEDGAPRPLNCSVLYVDRDARALRAYDRITVAGLGGASVRIERHVVAAADVQSDAETPG